MRLNVPDSYIRIRVRFRLHGYEVDIYSVPGKQGHTWNALIIHPENMLDRTEILGLDTYAAAVWAANEKSKELALCPRKALQPSPTKALALT
jgi:hypothetical protein